MVNGKWVYVTLTTYLDKTIPPYVTVLLVIGTTSNIFNFVI